MDTKICVVMCISLIIIATSNYAIAKCPIEIYKVKGFVLDVDKKPLILANVSVFFDDNESGYMGMSNEAGQFKIEYHYQTYKGPSLFGDRCGKIPSILTVVVQLKGYFSKKVIFKIKEHITKEDINLIEIPPITLIQKWEGVPGRPGGQ